MEIRLSQSDLQFDLHIQDIAKEFGCFASVKWATNDQVRFTLVERPGTSQQADYAVQDQVIHALLKLDPQAEIRTAKAIYKGLMDFEKQKSIIP
jgi:hypothetical protein